MIKQYRVQKASLGSLQKVDKLDGKELSLSDKVKYFGGFMASRTGKTRMARKVRKARKGKARKRKEQNKGTTPKFPIHT